MIEFSAHQWFYKKISKNTQKISKITFYIHTLLPKNVLDWEIVKQNLQYFSIYLRETADL